MDGSIDRLIELWTVTWCSVESVMETVCANGVDGDHHQLDGDAGVSGEMDVHTAARHGTAATVERLSQLAGDDDDHVRQRRRGIVDAAPAHDAAAAGNIATLTWLLIRPHHCPVY